MSEIALGSVLFAVLVVGLSALVIAARTVLQPARQVMVTVNQSREVPGQTGRKLLGVLSDAGISLPSSCGGAGTCGLCRVTVTDGARDPLPTEVNRMSQREVAEGLRLACQLVLRGDITISVPEELLDIQAIDCRVASNRALAPLIKELTLDLPEGHDMEIPAGAFVQVTAPPYHMDFSGIEIEPEFQAIWAHLGLGTLSADSRQEVSRAYSIANRPSDAGRIVLNIRLALPPPETDAPPGIVSSYLFGLKPGDLLTVSGPYGSFRARETGKEMVFIGGGVGMAPLRAIIFDQLERLHTDRKMSFWYGARSPIELFYENEFNQLAAAHDNFHWTVALSDTRPEEGWTGATGFIHEVVFEQYLKNHPAPEDCEYYLCGPPLMIKAVFAMLDNLGVERDNILFDDFGG